MILSTPFSRQNRSHQSWTPLGSNNATNNNNNHHHQQHRYNQTAEQNNTSFSNGFHKNTLPNGNLRKFAPQPPSQPAPKQPASQTNGFNHHHHHSNNNLTSNSSNNEQQQQQQQFRSHTLNRLDVLKARQQRLQALNNSKPLLNNNSDSKNNNFRIKNEPKELQIYAPASIASPAEFVYKNQACNQGGELLLNNNKRQPFIESNHYASTSCRDGTVSSLSNNKLSFNNQASNHYATLTNGSNHNNSARAQSGSLTSGSYYKPSGRESSLGSLFSRFSGSLKRKTRLLSLRSNNNNNSRKQSTPTPSFVSTTTTTTTTGTGTGTKSRSASETPTLNRSGPPPKITSLDPEIYGPLGKKEIQAEEIYAEGLVAIDGNSLKRLLKYEIEDESLMSEGELRTLIDDNSMRQLNFRLLKEILINWLNDELSGQRIIVKDLQDDLYDGQVLSKLIEKLETINLDLVEITQNELNQKYKLNKILNYINRKLSSSSSSNDVNNNKSQQQHIIRWSVEGIHGKNLVEIIFLLLALANYYKAPIKVPPNVSVQVLIVKKYQGQLINRSQQVQLTPPIREGDELLSKSSIVNTDVYNEKIILVNPNEFDLKTRQNVVDKNNRDVFDTLVEFAPDKLEIVKQTLIRFVNRHLNKINMSLLRNRVGHVLEAEQFSDGLILVFLISSLEDYFIPLGNLFTSTPQVLAVSSERKRKSGRTSSNNNNNNNDDDDESIIYNQKKLPDIEENISQTALEPDSYTNTQPIHKLHNVNFALQLIEEAGVSIREKVRAEDIVNGDLKAVLRVLYALFSRYKHL